MFISIVPSRGQWMDYRCRLVRKFIQFRDLATGGRYVRAIVQAFGTSFFVPALLLSMLTCLFLSSSLSLSYFILAVPMRKCLGQHSCTSSTFSITILDGQCFQCFIGIIFVMVREHRCPVQTRNNDCFFIELNIKFNQILKIEAKRQLFNYFQCFTYFCCKIDVLSITIIKWCL